MAHKIGNRIVESTTSTGSGPLALTAVSSYKRFGSVMSIGDTCWYLVEAVDVNGLLTGAWELGRGSYSAANALMRNTVLDSSNGGNPVNFGAGSKRVSMTALAPNTETAGEWRSAMGIVTDNEVQMASALALLTSVSAYLATQAATLALED